VLAGSSQRPRCKKGFSYLFRKRFRIRVVFCVNLFSIILAGICQAQAQPGAESTNKTESASTTNAANPDQRVVLKIGDQQITQAAFEQYIADLEAQQGPAELSRKKLGENYASVLMLSRIASENHLDSTPEVERQIAIDRMQILSNAEFAKLKAESAPTKQEIQAYYDAHLADYDVVEMRRLFIWPGDPSNGGKMTAEQTKALADAVRQAYASGNPARVDKLVEDTPHSKDEIVFDAKPLPFQRGELPGKMNDTVFSLKQGEWKEIDNGPGAYLFIQIVSRSRRDLSQVSAQIEKKVQAEKLKAELEDLKKKTGIWMDETYFVSKPPMPKIEDRD
jgi:PPIC-type PPIASE domain